MRTYVDAELGRYFGLVEHTLELLGRTNSLRLALLHLDEILTCGTPTYVEAQRLKHGTI